MNSPSPLVPQGSNLEQQTRTQSSLKVKILCALGVNVAVLLVLLMQGCKREQPKVEPENYPVVDTNLPPPTVTDTNLVVTNPAPVETNVVTQVQQPPVEQPGTTPVPVPVGEAQQYKIQKGDSYYSIGKKFNVSSKALQAANPTVDPAKLQIGKAITIPAPSAPAAAPTGGGVSVAATTGETTYTVKSGDTLGKLATEFHTTVKALQAANNLSDTRIKVGQKLKIPAH